MLTDTDIDRLASAIVTKLRLTPRALRKVQETASRAEFLASDLAAQAIRIRDAIEEAASLPKGALASNNRQAFVLPARYAAILCMREELMNISTPQIGMVLGDRDHTTILQGLKMAKKLRQEGEIGWLLTAGRKALVEGA